MADLRLALQRAEQQQARKEDYLREEISELQQVTSAALTLHSIIKTSMHQAGAVLGWNRGTHHSPVVLHRGFRRLRPGTRNSARASHQQRVPCCDRLRIYRRRWVGRQHPGKNWRKTSRIDWVRVPSYILLSDMSVGSWEELMLHLFFYIFLIKSADSQAQLAISVEKERSASEDLMSFRSQLASLESQNSLFRQEKARLLSQLEAEKNKREKLEDECCR